MTEYIDAIHGPDPQPLSAQPTLFDPKSPSNQKLLAKVQRNKMVHGVFLEWLDTIGKEGKEYILHLSKVYDDVAKVI